MDAKVPGESLLCAWIKYRRTPIPEFFNVVNVSTLDNDHNSYAYHWIDNRRCEVPEFLKYPGYEKYVNTLGMSLPVLWLKRVPGTIIPKELCFKGFQRLNTVERSYTLSAAEMWASVNGKQLRYAPNYLLIKEGDDLLYW